MMRTLSTPRLHLVPLTAELLSRRAEEDGPFEVLLELPEGARAVTVGPTWTSEVPQVSAADTDEVEGHWVVVDRESAQALGEARVVAGEDPTRPEVACAIVDDARDRGLGTEAVGALAEALLGDEGVEVVRSRIRRDDIASQRVLENNGFARTGSAESPDPHGHSGFAAEVVWERRR